MNTFALNFGRIRPLPGVHWVLPTSLVACGLLMTFLQPCKRGPYYIETVALTALILVVTWANHLAKAPISTARAAVAMMARSAYDLGALIVLWFIACIPFAVLLPAYQCYTDRARASEILVAASEFRSEIETRANRLGTTIESGVDLKFAPKGRVRAGFVTSDGAIVAIGDDPAVAFLLTPRYVGGKIEWSCQGFPAKFAPASCRAGE